MIARRYHLDGRTRVQIGEQFGISRFNVAPRILEDAGASGMVEITIHNPGSIDVNSSTALPRHYGLEHAYAVVIDGSYTGAWVEAVAKATAELRSILQAMSSGWTAAAMRMSFR